MKKLGPFSIVIVLICFFLSPLQAQEVDSTKKLSAGTFAGLEFRGIGPAFMSGRIADIAIHPENKNTWFIAVGSGGVWKTDNAGITWKSIFDGQKSYSIGCITIDPNNQHVVWVGTGENVGGRHVGYGDGIYRSDDGGASWKNMGLKESQHISKIIVHPKNSDIIWVAAQGPLWSKGGERGLYKTTDGGTTWEKVLGDEEWTGVTDIAIDPRNPDQLYAATWQRHRNVANYMGGGPGSGIHRSTDGGETWEKLKKGLPGSNMGKIGLAISPQKPDVIYAAIELDRRTGGVFKSSDRGSSWSKQSEAVSGATGPHYYQELYASPHEFDRIYLMDVRIQVSDDGGKKFRRLNEKEKHSDNHTIAFSPDDPNWLLVGTDGGLYESFDLAENWRFISTLPVTQYYKVAVDDAEPFYNIYGGTQDNGTQGGPSRTDKSVGIPNSDWSIVYYADGHQPATEPGNPAIVYAESQEGGLQRLDRVTGESIYIQPQPEEGEDYERFNWDSPILVSPHLPSRIYFASQRVWRSDNRGDSWTAISGDLTKDQERMNLPLMDQTWSWDSPWDVNAMSTYNTITSLAESPQQEGLIYAGTDDGLIQVTEDGGENWRKIEVGNLPGVPETAFVNDIKADLFDANTVYVALDNHKFGDLNPYLLKSTNRGKSWQSMKGNIPERTLVWRLVQDHVNSELFFLATEFGIYFTIDAGDNWIQLKGGLPTISFRDLAIQRRENDLVGASFGRSFYILDDYSVLRYISEEQLEEEASIFPVRDALWYKPKAGQSGGRGVNNFIAPNPPFGAVFTYYLSESYKTKKAIRQEEEKNLIKEKKPVTFPGWDAVEAERLQEAPKLWLTVRDENGNVVRRIEGPAQKGIHRIAWDFRYPAASAIDIDQVPSGGNSSGKMAPPGAYTVTLSKQVDGEITELTDLMSFKVVQLYKGALEGSTPDEILVFASEVDRLILESSSMSIIFRNAQKKLAGMQYALSVTPEVPGDLDEQLYQLKNELQEIERQISGNKSREQIGEKDTPTFRSWLYFANGGTSNITYGPTAEQKRSLEIAGAQFKELKAALDLIVNDKMPAMEKALVEAGAPWLEGQ